MQIPIQSGNPGSNEKLAEAKLIDNRHQLTRWTNFTSRVTRLGVFSPIGRLFTLDSFAKN
jgi:hypothetical protein